ncbi:MAG: nucleotidyltransferase substrate binding protein [Oligoflexales bacterium]|nr:nucleotidyltransferase substrate binding protein [Oligoflexales bacterium]
MTEDIRWKQRYENFDKALQRLFAAQKALSENYENDLYRIALIGAFEFTFELGWKTLKDYLKYGGVNTSLPREVIKQAFHYALIEDGQGWIDMLEDRNIMSHAYDEEKSKLIAARIMSKHISALSQVHKFLKEKLVK